MVRRVRAGNAHPFDALARAHHDALVGFATRLCGDAAEGRDVVQDAFERALRSFDQFDSSADGRSWLLTIVHNTFIDRCRKRARAPRTEPVEAIDRVAVPVEAEDAPPPWADVTADELRAAIEKLEPEFREVYTRHANERRSYQEIADALGLPVNTVGTRLARARRKLRAILTETRGGQAP
jgi:RNA polymerase sigma-70 factor (ECF subfamily)